MKKKRPAWSWADYHRAVAREKEDPDFLQLLLPKLKTLTPKELVELAERAGLSKYTLYHWLDGKTRSGTGRSLTAVAKELGYELVETKDQKPQLRVIR